MTTLDPDLRRTWLFGPGAGPAAHAALLASAADVLIADLEDFTPPGQRAEARRAIAPLLVAWNERGKVSAVRINALETEGPDDLAAAMPGRPCIVAYPMASTAAQMQALHAALSRWEERERIAPGTTEILPVCETAAGVVEVRAMAAASPRIRCALLGAEDLAADLCAERQPEATELDYARRRFLLECRAAGIEPVDAPYTFADVDGAVREARFSRRLGYRCKSAVLAAHVGDQRRADPGRRRGAAGADDGAGLRGRARARRGARTGRRPVGGGADLSQRQAHARAGAPARPPFPRRKVAP